ncbi:MAG TPA: ABC transporter ATP-binding protein [Sedimentibacter sp.]|nr:ABC transporter ATP-binding protein [Sedimentibacter sp.]
MRNMYNTQKYQFRIIVYIGLQVLKSIVVLLPPYIYLILLNKVIMRKEVEWLWWVVFLYILVYILKAFIQVIIRIVYNKVFPMMNLEIKNKVLLKLSDLTIYDLPNITAGEFKGRLHNDTDNVVSFLEKKIQIIINFVQIVLMIGILIYLNWILAVVSFLVLPISYYITQYIKNKSNIQYEIQRELYDTYNNFMLGNLLFWKEVKTNCLQDIQEKQFEKLWIDLGNSFLKSHIFWFLNRTFLAFKDVFLTRMGLYLLGGILVINGFATVPALLVFMEYYTNFVDVVLSTTDIIIKRGEQEVSIDRINDILNLDNTSKLKKIEKFNSVKISNINFKYKDQQEFILNDFSLQVMKGETVAIIGESGCGKSTLIKIMAGCLKELEGNLYWNDVEMGLLDMKELYSTVGFLMQESLLFNLTIRENLLFGKNDANEEDLIKVCNDANILEFILSLPEKFETIIGEKGVRLSGGQKQRLLIARLFLQQSEVIVFDEATSALDYENEYEILNMLLSNMNDEKTLIMITHRETLLSRCNRVIHM